MGAPEPVLELVERFHEHRDAYKSPDYNEAQVQQALIVHERMPLKPQIAITDREIDQLYGVSDDGIRGVDAAHSATHAHSRKGKERHND